MSSARVPCQSQERPLSIAVAGLVSEHAARTNLFRKCPSASALRSSLPVIFLSGDGDVTSAVRAMKAGAADFLEKPVADEVLITAVRASCAQEAERRIAAIDHRYDADRTPEPRRRKREIAALLLTGVAR